MLEKLEEAVADEEPALVQETNGVQAAKMEAAAVGAPAPAKIAAVAVAEPPKKVEKKVVVEEEKVAVSEPPLNFDRLKSVGTFVRTLEIWGFVFNFLFRRVSLNLKFTYKGGFTEAKKLEREEALAKWLRLGLLRLGPTFIKIGQQFSTRVDVLSKPFIKELEKLQQRPGLKEIFDIDLKNLRVIAQWLQKVDPKTDGAARDWVAIFDETARCLYDEVDYMNEAKNAKDFAAQFAGTDWIKVPRVYEQYTAKRTMCMEYAPATKINDLDALQKMGVDPDRMARLAVESYLMQVLRFGFFHADPHPGNVAVDKGDAEGKGRLVIYDYGMMGRIDPQVRSGFLDLFYAVFEKNSDSAVKALGKMGVLVDGGDMTAVKRTADFFLGSFDNRVEDQQKARTENKEDYEAEFKPKRTKEEKKERRKQILSNIGEDLLVVSKDQPFRFPAELTFVVRAFSVLDGIGKSLNKKFDIGEISAPYARNLLIDDNPSALPPQVVARQRDFERRFDRQNKAIVNLFKGPDAIEEIADIVRAIERGRLKIRVRALEAERALERVQVMQGLMLQAMVACAACNVGVVLYVSGMLLQAKGAFGVAGLFAMQAVVAQMKLGKLIKKEAQYSGAA